MTLDEFKNKLKKLSNNNYEDDKSTFYIENYDLTTVDFNELVISNGYIVKCTFINTEMNIVSFHDIKLYSNSLENILINNCHFGKCELNYNIYNTCIIDDNKFINSDFLETEFSNIKIFNSTFNSTDFIEVAFFNTIIINTYFNNCVFDSTIFKNINMENIVFKDIIFKHIDFRDIVFKDVEFKNCKFKSCKFEKRQILNMALTKDEINGLVIC